MSATSVFILFTLMIVVAGFSSWARLSLVFMRRSRFKELFGQKGEEDNETACVKKAEGLLLSVLVAANMAKVATPLLMLAWLTRVAPGMAGGWRLALSVVASVIYLLVFSELLPRVLVGSRREPTMRFGLLPLLLINTVVFPVRVALQRVIPALERIIGRKVETLAPWSLRAARSTVLDAKGGEAQLKEDERVLISSIFDMSRTIVREVMVPRVDMHCVEQEKTLAQARQEILKTVHSRFPVYARNIDNIVGLFLAKDLLKYSSQEELASVRVKDVMHPITFVPETKNLRDLLKEFQQNRQHMAVVVDEYGNTAGLVTIEDLVEEIVGEIEDEFGQAGKRFVETKDGAFIVDAKMSIGDLAEQTGIKLPEDTEYDTIGGFVVATLGKVPRQGETFQSTGVGVTILEADERRVHRVELVPFFGAGQDSPDKRGEEA